MRFSALAAAWMLASCAVPPLPAPRPDTARPPAPTTAGTPDASSLEREIHGLVNRHRSGRGLPPLAYDPDIAGLAREHSRAMAARRVPFGHAGFDQRAAAVRALTPVRSLAENVAYDSRTGAALADLVVRGWIGSRGHRENIQGDFDVSGVGVAEGPDGVRYFTQIFAARRR